MTAKPSDILHTSKLIRSTFEDEKEFNSDIDFDTYLEQQFVDNYNLYRYKDKISIKTIKRYIDIFDKLNMKLNIYTSFVKPELNEYFNPTLNRLLITDFLLSIIKLNDDPFLKHLKQLNFVDFFTIFIELSYFFDFVNFLDVDNDFLNYLKFHLVLFSISLNRASIDKHFGHISWILDEFFKHEVCSLLLERFDMCHEKNEYYIFPLDVETNYNYILKEFDLNIDYKTDEYKHLDNLFYIKYGRLHYQKRSKWDNTIEDIIDVKCDKTNWRDVEYDYDSYYYGEKPKIKSSDPNYSTYIKQFMIRKYQFALEKLNARKKMINESNLRIKDYSFFYKLDDMDDKNKFDKVRLLSFIGELLNYENMSTHDIKYCFREAYEQGHLELVKQISKYCDEQFISNYHLTTEIDKMEINQFIISTYKNNRAKIADNVDKYIKMKNT